ncbi:polyribonucleotide nucleotidyltransferase [Acidithrix ferrooxidans]|uniref:Polyribonucleotide nucleotidyltransferase n=1 Tax=Acidithrix ferrooxidans TaxID=1280514 RepID=A0A0D8HM41_9ACTN|nr:polyribonucleotide nucleotidyltransferase [Acidithrix ferrooxidans]KJF18988.1 polyribonucleotide nucleotidyltransferase [Acidithrix ferrooxidans]
MKEIIKVQAQISGTEKTISFETGLLAPLADGSVVARLGDTMVLATAVASKSVKEGIDFFPLTVDVEERMYAAGKIPGSFFRREGKATDFAVLASRLTDRPIRPCFPKDFRHDVHIVGTVLGADSESPYDVLFINAASAALMISGIPFNGPVGAVRIAYSSDGSWIANPSYQDGDDSSFELVVAGRQVRSGESTGDIAIIMVEAGGTAASWKNYQGGAPMVTEEVIAEGLEAAKTWIRESIALQHSLVEAFGNVVPMAYTPVVDYSDEVYSRVSAIAMDRMRQANVVAGKAERAAALDGVAISVQEELAGEFPDASKEISAAIRSITKTVIRERIVNDGVRIDGRDTTTIRPLTAAVGLIPTAHGSGLFQRGETQVLNVCTLGMPKMNQMLDSLGTDDFKRYMHHYNFPPFSTGEVGFMRAPKRREIGHGLLAERALLPVIPPEDEFPYTLRLVSEALASNGSTSMASVCGSTLSLMDAGVPIKAPVGGIAMGLVLHDGKYTTLTDILGAEDAFGDMDFKVAGTSEFVTALQLDTKIDGIPASVLASALSQAKTARLEVLRVILETLPAPRLELNHNAPKIVNFEIPLDKMGEIIGPKGKVINAIQQETGTEITLDEDGETAMVTIGAKEMAAVNEARDRILAIINPPLAQVGGHYSGKVVGIAKFGAFVNILPGRDGLLHISKIGGGRRIDRVEDVLSMGQELRVVVDDIDPNGKLSLSLVTDRDDDDDNDDDDDGGDRFGGGSQSPIHDRAPVAHEPATPRGGDRIERNKYEEDDIEVVSFEAAFEDQLRAEYGDLGPEQAEPRAFAGNDGGRDRDRNRRSRPRRDSRR